MSTDAAMFVGKTSDEVRHLELDTRSADVLPIGSQLTHGRVGLNAALPVYDAAGLRHAAIPSVIFSVLPHYPSAHRVDMPAGWIVDSLGDLAASGALDHVHTLSVGYLASPEQAHALAKWRRQVTVLQQVPLVLDPTLGDIGLGFYNDPALVRPLRDALLPVATGLTPNLFELAHLTGCDPADLNEPDRIEQAARSLLDETLQWVVVTGIRAPAVAADNSPTLIGELLVTHDIAQLTTYPCLDPNPAGVGDTFTAALITHLVQGHPLTDAVQRAANDTARYIRPKA